MLSLNISLINLLNNCKIILKRRLYAKILSFYFCDPFITLIITYFILSNQVHSIFFNTILLVLPLQRYNSFRNTIVIISNILLLEYFPNAAFTIKLLIVFIKSLLL